MNKKPIITATLCLIIIFASGFWIYKTQMAPPEINVPLHQGIGERLAAETVRAVGGKGKVLVITLERGESQTLNVQEDAFSQHLKKVKGMEVGDTERVQPEKGGRKYAPGSGLSARRLIRLLEKNKEIDVIVSFLGLPEIEEKQITGLGTKVPKLVAFARSTKKLYPLLKARVVQAVIVPRFQFPAPGTGEPHTPAQWFDLHFQVLTEGKKDTPEPEHSSDRKP